ncbi:MAG: diguanylate cyclase [Betaproteobacteria bacterium]|nr:MAG: diguanylate cyclase [Betaproteobacteria bacterium]
MTKNDLLAGELFDLAPVALFHSDFNGVYELLGRWRAAGIEDIEAHLRANPKAMDDYYAAINVLKVNRRSLELYGTDSLEQLLAAASSIFAQENREAPIREIGCFWRGEREFHSETVNHKIDGTRLELRIGITRLDDANMPWDRVLVALEDLTQERAAQRRVTESERYAQALFDYSPISLWVNDFSEIKNMLQNLRDQGIEDFRTFINVHPDFVEQCMGALRTVDVNQQTLAMFGATSKQELLSRLGEIFRDEMAITFSEQLMDLWNGKLFQQREIVNYTLKGDMIHAHMQWSVLPGFEATWERALVALTDISARKKAEAYLEFLGKHDSLTKLRNRSYFDEEINRIGRRGPFPTAVVVMDINGLKPNNDQHGHAAGDALIRRAAEVIKKACGDAHQPARTGGDEFSVLLLGQSEAGAKNFIDTLQMNIELNNQFYPGARLSISAGWAVCEKAGELESSIRAADQRMYENKRTHYGRQS